MNELIKKEVQRFNGMFYGALTPDEQEVVDEAIKRGFATKVYEGTSGFMGLSKVQVL